MGVLDSNSNAQLWRYGTSVAAKLGKAPFGLLCDFKELGVAKKTTPDNPYANRVHNDL